MSENQYQPRQRIRTTGRFRAAGAYADPTTITVKLADPHGILTTFLYGLDPEVVRDAVGRYHMDLTTGSTPGRWVYRYEGDGAVEAGDEEGFRVMTSAIP
jgi:hypothetical protein